MPASCTTTGEAGVAHESNFFVVMMVANLANWSSALINYVIAGAGGYCPHESKQVNAMLVKISREDGLLGQPFGVIRYAAQPRLPYIVRACRNCFLLRKAQRLPSHNCPASLSCSPSDVRSCY